MQYNFDPRKVNRQDYSYFGLGNRFVGFILPDGTIYKSRNGHAEAALETGFITYILNLKQFFLQHPNYSEEELNAEANKILDLDMPDKLISLMSKYFLDLLKENGEEKIMALAENYEIKKENQGDGLLLVTVGHNCIPFKEFIISAFGCHYISGIDQEIVTAAPNYKTLFAKYISGGCKITHIPRIVYSAETHSFCFESEDKEKKDESDIISLHKASLETEPNFSCYGEYDDQTVNRR